MSLGLFAVRNLLRNRLRTGLTVLGVAIAVLAFVLLQTVITSWLLGITTAAKDRVVTRHKVTFVMSLPKRYVEQIREIPGVTNATWANWFGGKDPTHPNEFFMAIAVDPTTYLDVYDELYVSPEAKASWIGDRQGAIVGPVIAQKFGWKVGDTITLTSDIFPGEWKYRVHAIYEARRKSADRSMVIFNWDYLNQSLPERAQEQVGWITSRIADPNQAARLSLDIDRTFEELDTQTLSQDEGTFQRSFMGMMTAILKAMNVVSIVILAIMMLILGNTVAMGVRERVKEYGVLRAIGFLPGHVVRLIVVEAATLGIVGGLAGLVIAYPLVELGMGSFLEENMSAYFPYFDIQARTVALSIAVAVTGGMLAAAIPAWRASRLQVAQSLRQIA